MKIVLDTNCFISCIGKNSPYRQAFDAFLNVTNDAKLLAVSNSEFPSVNTISIQDFLDLLRKKYNKH